MLKDSYGRSVTNLRISLTQRCNLDCPFCHKEGDRRQLQTEMFPKEIQKIVSIAASFGVDKIKLTGGEPLLRKDIQEIVTLIHAVPGISEISLTTNGIFLDKLAQKLKTSGLNRVNISLGTLRKDTYIKMTGVDAINNVLEGVSEAVRVKLEPIKLNMVVLKGINDDQISEMLNFAKKDHMILQLIEVESGDSDNEYFKLYHKDLSRIEETLRNNSDKIIVREMQHRQKFFLKNGGEVEVVHPMHNTEFCNYCNRLRLTSDGKLKPCLFDSENLIDILTSIRKNSRVEKLQNLYTQAIAMRKPYFV